MRDCPPMLATRLVRRLLPRLQSKVKRHNGVRDILVGLLAAQAEIEYYPDLIDPDGVAGLVSAAGFEVRSQLGQIDPSLARRSHHYCSAMILGPFSRQGLCALFAVMCAPWNVPILGAHAFVCRACADWCLQSDGMADWRRQAKLMSRSNDAMLVLQYEGGADERTRGKVEGCAKGAATSTRFPTLSPAHFSAPPPPHPARAVCHVLLGAHADRVVIGAWNPML